MNTTNWPKKSSPNKRRNASAEEQSKPALTVSFQSSNANAAANTRNKPKQPNRTTKTSQKLALFPLEDGVEGAPFEDSQPRPVDLLPRVTAYCTASSYKMKELMAYLQSLKSTNATSPKRFDEVIFTPFSFNFHTAQDLIRIEEDAPNGKYEPDSQIFFFDYGVVVFWGMTVQQERQLLSELSKFEEEKLDAKDVETEELLYCYDASAQPKIYNDIITLRHPGNYMVKLAIAHGIAQSTKLTLFEGLVDDTIESTKHIPQTMAQSGKVHLSRTGITKMIGRLFIMRININLVSNVLDTPEIFWSEPQLEPLYQSTRKYLEISQRVELLNQRMAVISDLLDMLKEHLTSTHGEQLEWIVIILIFFEIVIGVITICVDAFRLKAQ
ncbi:uncharacterized protein VTP21DRAFT_871 [Calcarisporiella thermophila]|uniref:uncharacterized protein n=1 Tax=Calcarisporiella thermophila TaxID=911321 RepID=UPI0037421523